MTSLSDTKRVLLATAAERTNGSLLPLPSSLKPSGGVAKAIAGLIADGFAQQRQHDDLLIAFRVEDDIAYGVFVTPAGLEVIGIAHEPTREDPVLPEQPAITPASPSAPAAPARRTKATAVLVLLQRDGGATLPELIEATGWLPHTTRAALTGLRKKGHEVTRAKRDGVTCYRVTGQAQ